LKGYSADLPKIEIEIPFYKSIFLSEMAIYHNVNCLLEILMMINDEFL